LLRDGGDFYKYGMRILFVLRAVVLSGGIERVFVDKANWLASHGHDILFLTYEQGLHPFSFPLNEFIRYEDLECRFFTVYQKSVFTRPFRKLLMKYKFKKRLHAMINEFRPEVMVIPCNLEEFQKVAISMNQYVSVIYESHSTFADIMKENAPWSRRFWQRMRHRCVKKCDLVISLTEGDAFCWRKYVNRVRVLPNPLTSYILHPVVQDNKRVICAGRLTQSKRFDRVIDAFSIIADKYPEWYVDIFGEGNLHEQLQEKINEHHMVGRVNIKPPTWDIYAEYQNSSFLVLGSDYESFGLVLVEAMACGIPVVSTDCPYGPQEIIENGKTGLLAKMDVYDLAVKMKWMITHDEERKNMGICAHESASKFQKDVVMKQWEEAYLSVLKE
jgi:glycosyltransferase involved in cell wall biosynthesis